jgi:gamma-glutamyltranspeptidase/glutathione hydrolase
VFPYRDTVVYELPPPTVGLVAAAMALRLEVGQDFRAAHDASYALRDRYITDPDFSAAPFEPFLDPRSVTAGAIDTTARAGDTCYLTTADEHGNVVSMIQSVAYDFGSGVVAEGTGMLLQNRGAYFKLDPKHVNRLEPKKRTMHTLIPAMAARNGRPWASFGTMGGPRQPQLQVQVLRNLVNERLDPAEAVARPRKMILNDGVTLAVEADYPGAGQMARSDSRVMLMPAQHHSFGHAHAIVIDGPAEWRAGADPRSDGSVEYSR